MGDSINSIRESGAQARLRSRAQFAEEFPLNILGKSMVAMTTGSRGDGLPFDKAARGRGGCVGTGLANQAMAAQSPCGRMTKDWKSAEVSENFIRARPHPPPLATTTEPMT